MSVKVEFTCAKEYKQKIKKYAEKKGISVASYVKLAVFKQMRKDEE